MRQCIARWLAAVLLAGLPIGAAAQGLVFADGFEPRRFCDLAAGPAVCPGFSATAPDFVLAPGEIATRSFYFRSPNAAILAVRRLAATRSDAVAQLLLMTTVSSTGPQECRPAGTMDAGACCAASPSAVAVPLLVAQRPTDDLFFTAIDGNGVPLALEIQADQPLCLQVTGINAGINPVIASARVQAEAQLPATPHVATAPLLAATNQINIPPLGSGVQVTHPCTTRAGTRFWRLSTRTFKRGIEARLGRGPNPLLVNLDWQAPQAAFFEAPGFVDFDAANRLVTTCTYSNPTPQAIRFGDDPETDETCEALGWFFPSSAPAVCFNGIPVLP